MRVSYAGCRGEYWGEVKAMRIKTHAVSPYAKADTQPCSEISLELEYGETFCWTMDASELEHLAYQLLDALDESRGAVASDPPELTLAAVKALIIKHMAEYPLEDCSGSNP